VNSSDESFYDSKGNLLTKPDHSIVGEAYQRPPVSIMKVFGKMWRESAVVFSVFFVTLSLFPGIISLIDTTTHSSNFSQAWFQIVLIVCPTTLSVCSFVCHRL
jgi:hypothetical protein